MNTFGDRLKSYRMRRKWTLEKVSAVTGVDPGTLSRIENNKVQPQDLTVAKILDAIPIQSDSDLTEEADPATA